MEYVKSHTSDGIGFEYINPAPPWKKGGVPVVFQHGISDNLSTWAHWWPRALQSRPVVAIDLRAHGSSSGASVDQFTIEQSAKDVLGVLDMLGLDSVHYVGSSFGGMLGFYLAATHQERIATLTTCSAPYRGDWVNNVSRWRDVLSQSGGLDAWCEESLVGFFTDDFRRQQPDFIEWLRSVRRSLPPDAIWTLFGTALHVNLEGIMPNITCPVLNMIGGSPFVDARNPQKLPTLIKQVEHLVIPDSRHGIIMSHWEECSAAAYRFMRRWELAKARSAQA
ncbi:alpha/beta fold hydrolase [Pseudorhodoferax sp.]|uniref:alpha/beta fold hydrolase n=1 Tax=Pseudorhodoferax sp. TaxID=1993553 RepID=UPI0039E3CD2D